MFYDVRPGERLRSAFMFLYLLLVLFSYYILKPVSQAMFLNRFDVDDLPTLIILVAAGAGVLAYLYSLVALRTSISHAVSWTMALATGCLVLIWWLLGMKLGWMLYVFNIFVGLFSIILVTQGWVVAGNVFNTREAKRIYPLLGMALVIGAVCGGEFTRRLARQIGSRNLVLAAACLVVLAYIAFLFARAQKGVNLASARAAESEETSFSITELGGDIMRSRHLQMIIAMMAVIFIVDVLVNFQFQVMAKRTYRGDDLTVFLGSFYGIWLSLTELVVQLLITSAVVSRFGVGGTLQIMPVSIMLASISTVLAPVIYSTSAVRLTESVSRYTLNKTGMELLYMPLPRELRNRIKAFIDIFFDRISRGIGGVILILFTRVWNIDHQKDHGVRMLSFVVIGCCIPWIWISLRARREYVATIRKRLAARRLDLENPRISAQDRDTVRLLEETAAAGNPRQTAYALELLAEAPGYDAAPILAKLSAHAAGEVRTRVYEIARAHRVEVLLPRALEEARGGEAAPAAVAYALAVAPDPRGLAREFLSAAPRVAAGAVQALSGQPELAAELITNEWLAANARSESPERRGLAAAAIGARGDQGTEALFRLLKDPDPAVSAAAARAAGTLRHRAYVHPLIELLPNARVRGAVIEALARYGPQICGALDDVLQDSSLPRSLRAQVPRVLKLIPNQRSVDVLLKAVGHHDLSIRAAVLKALNRLRETAPRLNFDDTFVTEQIYREARYYFELGAALAPLRNFDAQPGTAANLLIRTVEERLRQTLDRLFRLLGLRYPPKEIYSTYLAVCRRRSEESVAAIEFLDNLLDRSLRRVLLPLLDAPEHLPVRARDLYGVDVNTPEAAVRELLATGDPWLVACAMAAAAELQLRRLAPDIAAAASQADPDVEEVARSAQAVLV